MEKNWKNKSFFQSLKNALNGIGNVIKTGKNIKIQFVFALIAIFIRINFKNHQY